MVILTLSKNNPIESAKEARFKEDVRTFQDELAFAVSKENTDNGGHRDTKISTSDFDEIKEYIPSFSKKYKEKLIIQDDELRYTKLLDEKEKEYAQKLNINKNKENFLPDEYKQVEYIESTGTQYIDIDVIPYKNFKAEVNFKTKKKIGEQYIVSSRKSVTSNDRFYLSAINSNGVIDGIGYNNYKEGTIHVTEDTEYYIVSDYTDGYQKVICNGSLTNESNYNASDTAPWSTTIYLFTRGVTKDFKAEILLYNCKLEIDGELVRNFIPCYSITTVTNADEESVPSNTVGLYDIVEGKFYTNQGTGTFLKGKDVNLL